MLSMESFIRTLMSYLQNYLAGFRVIFGEQTDFPMKKITLLILYVLLIAAVGCKQRVTESKNSKIIEIRGIYGSPNPFWEKSIRLDELKVNSIFLSGKAITPQMMERADNEGLKVFAEFPVLNGEGYVEDHPEAWAVDNYGFKVKPASWFLGVCPTEPGFRKSRMDELTSLLRKFDLDGIWMDYLHWHAQFEEPEPILPETCFCSNCITSFESATGIKIPAGSISLKAEWILANKDSIWRDWRCTVVAGWAEDIKEILNREKPGALLGAYHCPWTNDEFDGARRRILGIDYDMLKDIVDVFSPMLYHGRMGREAEWVRENTEWFCGILRAEDNIFPKVWPIVQAYNDPDTVSAQEFEKVLKYGTSSCATGIMMFTSNAVAESAEKMEIMKKVYSEAEK